MYRIIEEIDGNGCESIYIQKKWFLWWKDVIEKSLPTDEIYPIYIDSVDEAKEYINKLILEEKKAILSKKTQ